MKRLPPYSASGLLIVFFGRLAFAQQQTPTGAPSLAKSATHLNNAENLKDLRRNTAAPPPTAARPAPGLSPEGLSEGVGRGAWSVGADYPGADVRYFLTSHYSLEAKAQEQRNVLVGGLRFQRVGRPGSRLMLFAGMEGDYVRYKNNATNSSGYAGELFAGLEYFILPRVTLQLDLGPSYVYLKDSRYSLSAGNVEYVANIGFNYYFYLPH